jgi:hypothetical protein
MTDVAMSTTCGLEAFYMLTRFGRPSMPLGPETATYFFAGPLFHLNDE